MQVSRETVQPKAQGLEKDGAETHQAQQQERTHRGGTRQEVHTAEIQTPDQTKRPPTVNQGQGYCSVQGKPKPKKLERRAQNKKDPTRRRESIHLNLTLERRHEDQWSA